MCRNPICTNQMIRISGFLVPIFFALEIQHRSFLVKHYTRADSLNWHKVHFKAVKINAFFTTFWQVSHIVFMYTRCLHRYKLHSLESNASSSFWSVLPFKHHRFNRFNSHTNPFHFSPSSTQYPHIGSFWFFRKLMLAWLDLSCFKLTYVGWLVGWHRLPTFSSRTKMWPVSCIKSNTSNAIWNFAKKRSSDRKFMQWWTSIAHNRIHRHQLLHSTFSTHVAIWLSLLTEIRIPTLGCNVHHHRQKTLKMIVFTIFPHVYVSEISNSYIIKR